MIESNFDLKPYNTFGISAQARWFGRFDSIETLQALLKERTNDQLLILGGGSNLLLTRDFDGLVLKNEIKGIRIIKENESFAWVEAGAGEVWHELVLWSIDHGLSGIENMSLIPGSVGASPMQNIGAYGVEIKDVFDHLEAYHIASGEQHRFNSEDCAFGYRESVFKHKFKNEYVITKVCLKLSKQAELNTSYGAIESELNAKGISNPGIRDVSNAVIAIRQSKLPDPMILGNAGSFFKNPVIELPLFEKLKSTYPELPAYPAGNGKVKVPAGWLIEQSGWKGSSRENHGVHKLQALVLVNYGGATGQQIWQLSEDILNDVKQRFGILLEREVNIL